MSKKLHGSFWKQLAYRVAETHSILGASLTDLPEGVPTTRPRGHVLMNVSKAPAILANKTPDPKAIRTFLWENRKSRFVNNRGVLWTASLDEGSTAIGLGVWVTPTVAHTIKGERFVVMES